MTLASRRVAAQQELVDAAISFVPLDEQVGIEDSDVSIVEWLDAKARLTNAVAAVLALQLETPGKVKAPWPKPKTSQEAAAYMAQYVEKPLGQIWLLLSRAHRLGSVGLTCEQVEIRTGIKHASASARINQLRDTGWIRDSGQRRNNTSGRTAIVWTPTEFGLESARQVEGWGWMGQA